MGELKVGGLDAFRDDPQRAAAVVHASEILESMVGRSAARTSATWAKATDAEAREIVRLTLKDWTCELSTDLAPDEFADEWHLEGRLLTFWGDFLEKSSDVLLVPILQSLEEHGGLRTAAE